MADGQTDILSIQFVWRAEMHDYLRRGCIIQKEREKVMEMREEEQVQCKQNLAIFKQGNSCLFLVGQMSLLMSGHFICVRLLLKILAGKKCHVLLADHLAIATRCCTSKRHRRPKQIPPPSSPCVPSSQTGDAHRVNGCCRAQWKRWGIYIGK